jgi:hypothetical protein
LYQQEDDSAPEDDLKTVQDHVGLAGVPFLEASEVLTDDLVEDDYDGFGSL